MISFPDTSDCGVEGIGDPVDLCYTSSSCGAALGLPGIDTLGGGPTAEKPGTIMTYCHLVGGGYSNISLTFGLDHVYGVAADRVPAVMQSHVASRASAYPGCLDPRTGGGGPLLSVQLDGTGSGVVISDPAGIDCGDRCSASFSSETHVTLSAFADGGSSFVGFSGDCGDGAVLMDADKVCTAIFNTLCGNGQLDADEACDGALFANSSPCGGCVGTGENSSGCPDDCGIPPDTEAGWCTDGIDNDCVGSTDSADSADCPTACVAAGASCTLDSDCCSNKCLGKDGGTCR